MPAHERDQSLPALLQGPPQLVVAGFVDPGPVGGRSAVPFRQHPAGEQVVQLGRDPRRRVHAVRHRADRHLVRRHLRPQTGEHDPADRAVQSRHPVAPSGQPQPHHRHVEPGLARLVRAAPEGHELVEADPALGGEVREVALHELDREAVDPGRNRRVGGEDAPGAHGLHRLGERQAMAHELPGPLQSEEPGVPLVGVEHLGIQAQRLQGAHTADAEEDLLADAVLGVAAVQAVRHQPAVRGVALHVAVQQVELHPPDVGSPDLGLQRLAREVDGDPHAIAAGQRQRVGIELGEALLLHPVDGEELAEVARAVEEPYADERDAEVARRLEVVAGEDTETAGVLREGLGDPELRGEVGDQPQRAGLHRLGPGLEPAGRGEVAVQAALGLVQVAQEPGVGAELFEAFRRHLAEQPHGIVGHRLPRLLVDPPEEVTGGLVPGPAQVHGQALERGQLGRQRRSHAEALEGTHGCGP